MTGIVAYTGMRVNVFAAMHVCAEVCSSRVGEQDEGERRDMSGVGAISFVLVY
jgi:hypothetical protein